ncbi:unnamed protein product [Phytomonas sp. Hart1]|nr:unnamed protein product [Phytomonas sp. Hart1]|eukprot:CCW70649.1 unnamed protein product [Phytomonas sp. isolate Hart1]
MALLLDDDEECIPLYKVRKTEDQLQTKDFSSSALPCCDSATAVLFNVKGGNGIQKMELLMYGSPTVLPTSDKAANLGPSDLFFRTTSLKSACADSSSVSNKSNSACLKSNYHENEDLMNPNGRTETSEFLSMDATDVGDHNNSRSVSKYSNNDTIKKKNISHSTTVTSVTPTGGSAFGNVFQESTASPDSVSADKLESHVERSLDGELEVQSYIQNPCPVSESSPPICANERSTPVTPSFVSQVSSCSVSDRKSTGKQQLKLSDFFSKMACKKKY